MNDNPNYRTTFVVDNTPQAVFEAINNPRGWWSQSIEGNTDRLGSVFNYHYQDVHRATFEITELVPNERVVWHVLDNDFNFIKDKSEWVGTDVMFDIVPQGDQTEVRCTHMGLIPDYECYEVCSNAWGTYISRSLRDLITTGQGQPNPIEDVVERARAMSAQHYKSSFTVPQTPDVVFAAVNNVRGWWSEYIEGETDRLGAVWTFRSGDAHYSVQQVTEWVPNERVVWHVLDSRINFVADKQEWTGTDIVFEIVPQGDGTELQFTHVGLMPAIECYTACSDAWRFYIQRSLYNLITTGAGEPERKDTAVEAQIARNVSFREQ